MSNLFDYLNENSQFQQLSQFGKEEQQAYEEKQGQGIQGIIESMPLASDVYSKGKEIYSKGKLIYEKGKEAVEKGQEAIGKLKENVSKVKAVVEDTAEKGKAIVEKGKGLAKEAIEEGKGLVGKLKTIGEDTKKKIISKAQEFKSLGEDEVNNLKTKYGDRFTTELNKLNEQKSKYAGELADKVNDKMKEVYAKRDELRTQLGREPTKEDLKPIEDEFTNYKKDLTSKFNDFSTNLESGFKQKLSGAVEKAIEPETKITTYNDAKSFLQRNISDRGRKILSSEFERDPESEMASERLNPTAVEKVSSFFRQGYKQPIESAKGGLGELATKSSKTLEAIKSEGENIAKKGVQKVAGLVEEGGQRVAGLASKASGEISQLGSEAVSKASSLASEAGSKAAELASRGASIAGEVAGAASGAVESVGSIVSESIPVVGELAGLGLGLYDIIHSFGSKPHVYSVAKPTFASGL